MSDAVKKLPVFETVGDSIKYTIRNFGLMLQLVWFWGGVMAAVSAVVYLLGGQRVLLNFFGGVELPITIWSGVEFLLSAALHLVYLAACLSVVVGWHRNLLLDERPAGIHKSFGKRELIYFLRTVTMSLVVFVPAIIIGLTVGVGMAASKDLQPGSVLLFVVFIVIAVCCFSLSLLWFRLTLILPGAAVGDRRVSLRGSFDLTRGNSWNLFAGFCLIGLFQFAVFGVLALAVILISGRDMAEWGALIAEVAVTGEVSLEYAAIMVAQFLFSLVFTFFALSYMSYCYWFFVPPPEEGDLVK